MKKILISIFLVAAGAFAWWTLSPLLIDKEVDDALPTPSALPKDTSTITVGSSSISEPILETPEDAANETSEPTALPSKPAERLSPITGTPGHNASGNIRIVVTPDEQIIRYEDYAGTNGPDLKVYLASDLEASEIVDLGPARANKGNINYSVPLDIDIDDYPYVLTWCEAFDVLFDYSLIN